MRNPNISRWPQPLPVGLLLMAQRLEEALSDYTLDSYRAPALNSHSRAYELRHAVQSTRRGEFVRGLLPPIVEELAESIATDSAAQELLGPTTEQFAKLDQWPLKDLQALEVRARYLSAALSRGYEAALRDRLIALIPTGREKRDIQRLATDLATEWVLRGYAADYVYFVVRRFFFSDQGADLSVDSEGALTAFFDLFGDKETEWSVVFRGSQDLGLLAGALPGLVTIVPKEELPEPEGARERDFLDGHDGPFVRVEEFKRLDPRGVSMVAEKYLETIASVAQLHDHRAVFDWVGPIWVYNDQQRVVLKSRKRAVERQASGGGRNFHERLARTVTRIGPAGLSGPSWNRITSTLSLHSAALQARRPEEQLLALWVALEALLPLSEAESRITKVIELTVPLLARQYPVKLIKGLQRDLRRCVPKELVEALKKVPAAPTYFEMCSLLIASETAQDARDELYAALGHNPLLKQRLYQVSEGLLSSDRIRETIDAHERRVTWHLFRMYRVRNMIVHTGRSLPYVESLVENLHAYVLRIMRLVEDSLDEEDTPADLDGALLRVALEHRAHKDALQRAGKSTISAANHIALLFGGDQGATT